MPGDGVTIKRLDKPCKRINFGDTLNFKVAAKLNGLNPDDVVVELMICRRVKHPQPCMIFSIIASKPLEPKNQENTF